MELTFFLVIQGTDLVVKLVLVVIQTCHPDRQSITILLSFIIALCGILMKFARVGECRSIDVDHMAAILSPQEPKTFLLPLGTNNKSFF